MIPNKIATRTRTKRITATLCWAVEIQRVDGRVHKMATHDALFSTKSTAFYTPQPGHTVFAQRREAGLRDRTTEISGIIDDGDGTAIVGEGITFEDLLAGRLKDSTAEYDLVNWMFPFFGESTINHVYDIADIEWDDTEWRLRCVSKTNKLKQKRGDIVSPLCQNELGINDGVRSFCSAIIQNHPETVLAATVSATITPTTRTFSLLNAGGAGVGFISATHVNDYFSHGFVREVTGGVPPNQRNSGLIETVEDSQDLGGNEQQITLQVALPFLPIVGDKFDITVGCDKQDTTCRDKFSSITFPVFDESFRAMPDVPGFDRAIRHPRAT